MHASAVEERGPVAIDLEQDEVRRDAARVEAARLWLGDPARRSRCRPCPPGPRPGAGRWRGRRPGGRSCRPARPARATSPAAARTPAWRIPPPTSLRARRARADDVVRADDDRADRAAEPLGQAERDRVGRVGQVPRGHAVRSLGDDGVPEPGAVDVERDAVAAGDRRDLARVRRRQRAGPSSGHGCSRA